MYRSSDLMMKIFSGNKKYIFPRFQLYARVYVRINLVPRAFPLKNGWGFSRPTHFFKGKALGTRLCAYMDATLLLYPHCISIVASPQTKGRIRDCPAKRYAARVGDAVSATRGGGMVEKSIRQNARFHTAAQRIIIDPN